MPYLPIADYAIIGDCRSAALVSRHGSIDWLCLPRFDSPSVFGALLDAGRGGRFQVAPAGKCDATRRYIPGTNVLETTFRSGTGVARLIDVMPVADEAVKARELWPEHEILRRLDVLSGEIEMAVHYEPRLDYGATAVSIQPHAHNTFVAERGAVVMLLRSEVPLTVARDGSSARGSRVMRAGERALLGWSFSHGSVGVMPADGEHADAQIKGSIGWWDAWAGQFSYDWDFRDIVLRSALTLKLLTYAPSGALVAAPTTSLPESIGGVRNWDYRYCWLRDASLGLRALLDLGFTIEGEAFLSWLLHATRLTQPKLQILYDVYGGADVSERQLEDLEGYRGSRPVRVGNKAAGQLQHDVYGSVVDAVHQYVSRGGRIDRGTGRLLVGLGETVCRTWREPDEGIWEPRSGRQHHTHSKVMCWLALERLIALHVEGHLAAPADRFRRERDAIRREVQTRGWDESQGSYVAAFGALHVDASLLRLGLCGFEDPAGDRMRRTRRCVERQLGRHGLLYRYLADDGLPAGEGAFGICGFWGVEAMALEGSLQEAIALFRRLTEYANDVGLFSEEIDADTGALLGNFPQGFTHLGVINAALTLAHCADRPQRRAVATARPKKV